MIFRNLMKGGFPKGTQQRKESRIMNPRISMITLGVRDLAGSVKFYEQGLGFPRMA